MRNLLKNVIYRILSRLSEGVERYNFLRVLSGLGTTIPSNFIIGRYPVIKADGGNIRILLGGSVEVRNYFSLYLGANATLALHEDVFFNNYCSINCLERITVGEGTIFGEGVRLYDHTHVVERGTQLIIHRNSFNTAPVIIGKKCWIASNVTILAGVEIGDNVVVGANNLIYKSIPSNTIIRAKVEYLNSGLE